MYTAEPSKATGIIPGSMSLYHCACGDGGLLAAAFSVLYVRRVGVVCHRERATERLDARASCESDMFWRDESA